jgi:hypothetical protein
VVEPRLMGSTKSVDGWLHVVVKDDEVVEVLRSQDGTVIGNTPVDAEPVIRLDRLGSIGLSGLLRYALDYVGGKV